MTADLLTFAAAARLLGVHPDDIRRWARADQCPVVRVGRAKRVPRAWIEEQSVG